jgi:hypothetical protein
MTTLADLQAGSQFLFVAVIASIDQDGYHLDLFGPAASPAGTAVIGPDGTMTGALTVAAAQVPVTVITGQAPVAVGDVLESRATRETLVCRWQEVSADGTVTWAAASSGQVVYPAQGWAVIGHVDLLAQS